MFKLKSEFAKFILKMHSQVEQESMSLYQTIRKTSPHHPLLSLSLTGGTLAITGTYLLVTFAPHTSTHITALLVQYYAVSWHFLLYLVCNTLKLSCL